MAMFAKTLLLALSLLSFSLADIVVENDLVKPSELYDFVYSTDSSAWWRIKNTTHYYCVFRSLWDRERHPREYPKAARWTDIVVYATTKMYRPWLKSRSTTVGIEKIAETGFTDTFLNEMIQAGQQVLDHSIGEGFFINQETWKDNYVFIPPIHVDFDYPFLNSISSMQPSPDWFTGFYLFDTVDEYERTFWERFTIRTYPWNAGTDAGESYTAPDEDLDPPENVFRIFPEVAPRNGAFLSEDGSEVLPVAEFDCELHVCPEEYPFCTKQNFPPPNYCDVLQYPKCADYCDPEDEESDTPCEVCRGNGYEDMEVYFEDCCVSGHEPRRGPGCDQRANSGTAARTTAVVSLLATIFASAAALFY